MRGIREKKSLKNVQNKREAILTQGSYYFSPQSSLILILFILLLLLLFLLL